jgi:hypothetical protein
MSQKQIGYAEQSAYRWTYYCDSNGELAFRIVHDPTGTLIVRRSFLTGKLSEVFINGVRKVFY